RASVDLSGPCDRHSRACEGGRMRVSFVCALLVTAGCSTDFAPQTCAVDSDCGNGLVCEAQGNANVCVHAEDAPLIIGESAPISGTNQALGTGMKLGIELAFDDQNAK